ncbi:hypothetical protein SLV14_003814 [Streptomyces sp. Je 1-4]|uniref:hypothetical protein n=1 Tax=Streptomyces TaxID=1883 RepID=UPI0021D84EBA|nr:MULTISPECIES: hypothetical protein [unclassified Streptomyces]UYB41116.1 hypothetical protein SLV14_003814 [Streptomyces sp. Je 1-4]UZQ37286.1 hypothetical protein SLV14N_003814 [Streptomyces sp. Je 1-4] [Streptomyces sp. Je 1-4 4N24]UZQ44703.1 hypothetical protein SLV14NA_003814 [Streptomyces sp. Je 1-4] [Streptomyces sp. Je 1-4 4N24_ara]
MGADEGVGALDGPVDIRLGGEAHDLIVCGDEFAHQQRIAHQNSLRGHGGTCTALSVVAAPDTTKAPILVWIGAFAL